MRPFFKKPCGSEPARRAVRMDHGGESAERIGKTVSTIFLIALLALFAYGYLRPLVAG